MKNISSQRSGFTLVEIMIVVAIIGLLASIAIPHFGQARMKAQMNVCISNLRQIEGAMQRWSLDMHKDEGQTVSYNDISAYLQHSVVCLAGGTTFGDSYTITTVDAPPVCQKKPMTHQLPP